MRVVLFTLIIAMFAHGFSINLAGDAGFSRNDVHISRIGVGSDFHAPIYQADDFYISGYYELSYNTWQGSTTVTAPALSPVFTFNFAALDAKAVPYLELGVGVSFISSTTINGRNMSSSFQFEDRMGVGIQFEKHTVYMRYMHYSNLGFVMPNEGIEIVVVGMRYRFLP